MEDGAYFQFKSSTEGKMRLVMTYSNNFTIISVINYDNLIFVVFSCLFSRVRSDALRMIEFCWTRFGIPIYAERIKRNRRWIREHSPPTTFLSFIHQKIVTTFPLNTMHCMAPCCMKFNTLNYLGSL